MTNITPLSRAVSLNNNSPVLLGSSGPALGAYLALLGKVVRESRVSKFEYRKVASHKFIDLAQQMHTLTKSSIAKQQDMADRKHALLKGWPTYLLSGLEKTAIIAEALLTVYDKKTAAPIAAIIHAGAKQVTSAHYSYHQYYIEKSSAEISLLNGAHSSTDNLSQKLSDSLEKDDDSATTELHNQATSRSVTS